MAKLILLILAANLFSGMGQVFFKKCINGIPRPELKVPADYLAFIKRIIEKYQIWLGMLALLAGTSFWLTALAQSDLNLAFSINSAQYIFILILSHFFLDEKIDRYKLAGTLLIVAGVMLVTLS